MNWTGKVVAFGLPIAAALSFFAAPERASAQDASFGCKVLLCAAASDPSWSGVPYCVPVMNQLFSRLANLQPWPTCPEGNASGVTYQPYQACPAGASPATEQVNQNGTSGGWVSDRNGGSCVNSSAIGQNVPCGNNNEPGCPVATARPRNANPYYVDITPKNSATFRFWFTLTGG